jgi:hypothetical protein
VNYTIGFAPFSAPKRKLQANIEWIKPLTTTTMALCGLVLVGVCGDALEVNCQ